jgi:hypothetical protein
MLNHVCHLAVENDKLDIPPGASIIDVEYQDVGGLGHQRRVCGVWIMVPHTIPTLPAPTI